MRGVGTNTSRSNAGNLLHASTMIFYLGCGLSIVKLAEILAKMQCSGPFSDCVFFIAAGRNGGVCVKTRGGEVLVHLEKSVFDSWPFIPDHTLHQLHTDLEMSQRWGLHVHTLKSFKVVSVSEKSENRYVAPHKKRNFTCVCCAHKKRNFTCVCCALVLFN